MLELAYVDSDWEWYNFWREKDLGKDRDGDERRTVA